MIGLFAKLQLVDIRVAGDNLESERKNNNKKYIYNYISLPEVYIENTTLNKFQDDKLFFLDENWVMIIDGVILNLSQIYKEENEYTLLDLILKYYKNGNLEVILRKFRGSFFGLIYNRVTRSVCVLLISLEQEIYYT